MPTVETPKNRDLNKEVSEFQKEKFGRKISLYYADFVIVLVEIFSSDYMRARGALTKSYLSYSMLH